MSNLQTTFFVRSADLPNLQKRCANVRLWSGFLRLWMVDSHVSRQNPTFHLKNRRTFAPFTKPFTTLSPDLGKAV